MELRWVVDRCRLWWAKLVEVAVASGFVVAFFYSYTGAFGVRSIVALDIASYFGAIAVGQWTSYQLISSSGRVPPVRVSLAVLARVVAGFGALTFAPPHIPLFRETSTGAYGPT